MAFPLKKREVSGYEFKEKTFYSAHHLGTDYRASYVPLYAPFDGEIVRVFEGKQGGITIWFKYDKYIIRFLHLSGFVSNRGKVNEGDVIGTTGNSGSLTKSPHLHIDISKNEVQLNNINNFLNPETFIWDNNMKNHKTKEIRKASKKYFGIDVKDRINSDEDRRIAKKIKGLYEELVNCSYDLGHERDDRMACDRYLTDEKLKDYKDAFFRSEDKLTEEIEKNKRFSATISGYAKKIKELDGTIAIQKETITDLENLKAKNYKAVGIITRLAEALRMVLKF